MAYSDLLIWMICSLGIIFFLAGAITSFIEKELRAGLILLIISLSVAFVLAALLVFLPDYHTLKFIFIVVVLLFLIVVFLPISATGKYRFESPVARFHEEDAVLSRRKLLPGTAEYKSYYDKYPDRRNPDDEARHKPGLLSPDAKYFNAGTFAAAKSNFILTDHLHALAELPPDAEKSELDGNKTKAFIKRWMLETGAHSIGFTALKDHHLYSYKGRGPEKGRKILNDLPHAIAITVEMDHDMMKPAPEGTTVMESAEQYLQSGILASKLTGFIKSMGYNAKAHIDGQYEVICPLVAADAGLGMIGRMGLLLTPVLGPRVRIVVVTTDIPLEYADNLKHDLSMLDFCSRCKKCAKVCPANAIPMDSLKEINGSRRWRINSEACYLFWTISGTDCGRCVISCPYAHPDNWFHRFIRWGIKKNLVFRVMAVKLDDIFYGERPKIKPLPHWAKL